MRKKSAQKSDVECNYGSNVDHDCFTERNTDCLSESTVSVTCSRTYLGASGKSNRSNEMKLIMKEAAGRLATIGAVVLALSAPGLAQSPDHRDGAARDTKQLVQLLRAGGYNIVIRHGATFSNQADTDPFNFETVTHQRNLNDKGKELARTFGDAVRRVGLPVGEVYTSKFNRAYETAVLAGFHNIERTIDLTEGGLVVTPDENNRRADAFRKMLALQPEKGKNNFLITHKPNIIDALGKEWFDVREGEASIFEPKDGTYHLIARIQMEDWPKLAIGAN
jgi:phosphohistidine phosphatase SixA